MILMNYGIALHPLIKRAITQNFLSSQHEHTINQKRKTDKRRQNLFC
jgi:hypothetical protein